MSDDKTKMRKKFSFRKLIYNDKYLIIFSVFTAVVIWVITSINLSPNTTKTISVPVNADFSSSVSEELGIKCYGDESFNVDVTVNVKKYLAKDITSDDINVELQTNSISTTGIHEIPITVSAGNSDFSIDSYYPATYTAYFDMPQEQEMEVTVNYKNDDYIAQGYVGGESLLNQPSVIISGPKKYVSQVYEVAVDVDLNKKINKTTTIDVVPRAIDIYGDTVDYITLDTASKKLSLTIPVLKKESLTVTASLTDVPQGVDTSKIKMSYSQDKITAGVLEQAGITSANFGEISFSKLGVGTNRFTFDANKLDGVTVLDKTEKITVTVNVPSSEFADKNVTVSASDINITGLSQDYTASASLLDMSAITVVGNKSAVDKINKSNIVLSCDLTPADGESIKTGSQKVKVNASVKDANGIWIFGSYTATVVVKAK